MKDKSHNINFITSRNIYDYKLVLEGLLDDFGYNYWHSVLVWCGILDDDISKDNFWKVYLIRDGTVVIGMCGLYSQYPNDNHELWLGWFGICPKFRRQKVGTAALDFMREEAKTLGCLKLMSYVEKTGKPLPFYVQYGFTLLGDVKTYLEKHTDLTQAFEDLEDFIIEMNI